MKYFLSFVIFATVLSSTSFAQGNGNQRKSPHDTVITKAITITYGRPFKKGRVIFGELEKFGKVWRAGADQATQITFNQDAKFGGQEIKKGTYTLFVIPEQNEWTIILNSQLGQWGAFSYEKYKDKDVLSIKVPVKNLTAVTEQFTIQVKKKHIILEWDKTRVTIAYKIIGGCC